MFFLTRYLILYALFDTGTGSTEAKGEIPLSDTGLEHSSAVASLPVDFHDSVKFLSCNEYSPVFHFVACLFLNLCYASKRREITPRNA